MGHCLISEFGNNCLWGKEDFGGVTPDYDLRPTLRRPKSL